MPDPPRTTNTELPSDLLIPPYGGCLINVDQDSTRIAELNRAASAWPSILLTPRQCCDLELLACGAFSPLRGFMSQPEYTSVCEQLRLADGTLWPLPITLDVAAEFAASLAGHRRVALRDAEGRCLAALVVDDVWQPDKKAEAVAVFGTTNPEHPGVAALLASGTHYVGGRIEAMARPSHYDYPHLRKTPVELRRMLADMGWHRIVAFQTRNPMHRAHVELTRRAVEETGAKLLIHPAVGMTKPGDVDHFTRVRCYQVALASYPVGTAMLALLPLAMRMAGPREVLLHAIIRRNYGCTHLIVGRDHAGPGTDSRGVPFYGPYEAQVQLKKHEDEIGVKMVPSREMVYVADQSRYLPEDRVPEGARVLKLSGSELRRRLAAGDDIPEWFTDPEVARQLRRTHPPRRQQGFTVFFTGLSGSGKSTIANVLLMKLLERGDRPVTLLDGDVVRQHLSSELGFSRAHRDLNIERIGFVAAQITRCGGSVLCAAIAPFDDARRKARSLVEAAGGHVLVHVATPLELCERRDTKGLYAKARAGLVTQFTGISDPYEVPEDADMIIDTSDVSADAASGRILSLLTERGYLDAVATEAVDPSHSNSAI